MAVAGSMEILLLILLSGGGIGVPSGMPPAAEDPVMHQIAPAECLAYFSWSPAGEPDATNGNHTEALIADPEVQASIAAISKIVDKQFRRLSLEEDPFAETLAAAGPGVIKSALTRAGAFYVSEVRLIPGTDIPNMKAGLAIHVGEDGKDIRDALESLQSKTLGDGVSEVKVGEKTFFRIQPDKEIPALTWGINGGYLLVAIGDGEIEEMNSRLTGEPPAWLSNIAKQLPIDRRSSVAYIDVQKTITLLTSLDEDGESKAAVAASGFESVAAFVAVTGLDETGFVSRSLIVTEGEPEGVFAMVGGAPLTDKDLAVIPHDAPAAFAVRIEPDKAFDQFLRMMKEIDPRAVAEIGEGLTEFDRIFDMDLRDDVLGSLGDTARIYASAHDGGLATGWTAVIDIEDADVFGEFHHAVLAMARAEFDSPYAPKIKSMRYGSNRIYTFHVPDEEMPFAPSWCLTDDHLVFGLFPQTVREFVLRNDDFKSLAELESVKSTLAADGDLQMMTYLDTKEAVKLLYPAAQIILRMTSSELVREGIDFDISLLPSATALNRHLQPSIGVMRRTDDGLEFASSQTIPGGSLGSSAPLALGMTLPAIVSARQAAQRAQAMNNLKHIALAMHNFHDTYGGMPAAYNMDKDGKPLLSWRVHILPFIEESALYEEFHFDEPWDSEHNLKLAARMPMVYQAPGADLATGKTVYLGNREDKHGVFIAPMKGGKEALHPKGVRFRDITDGTSNTVMVVEANASSAVTWTKPDDFEIDAMAPMAGLLGLRKGGFQAAFCDGSVQMLPETLDKESQRRLFQRNDGEVVEYGRYESRYERPSLFGRLFGFRGPRVYREGAYTYPDAVESYEAAPDERGYDPRESFEEIPEFDAPLEDIPRGEGRIDSAIEEFSIESVPLEAIDSEVPIP